jgi:hypothetical protein
VCMDIFEAANQSVGWDTVITPEYLEHPAWLILYRDRDSRSFDDCISLCIDSDSIVIGIVIGRTTWRT